MSNLERLIRAAEYRTREAEQNRVIELLKKENKSLKCKLTKLENKQEGKV